MYVICSGFTDPITRVSLSNCARYETIIKIAHALASLCTRAEFTVIASRQRVSMSARAYCAYACIFLSVYYTLANGNSSFVFLIKRDVNTLTYQRFNAHRLSVVLITYLPQTIGRSPLWFPVRSGSEAELI